MGLLDQVAGQLLGGALGGGNAGGGGGQGALANLVMGLLKDPNAVQGVVRMFQDKGLGHAAESWVGTGANQPVSAEQVTQAFGPDQIAQFAKQTGLGHGDVASGLASLLPQAINHLTPNGRVEGGGVFQQALGALLGQR